MLMRKLLGGIYAAATFSSPDDDGGGAPVAPVVPAAGGDSQGSDGGGDEGGGASEGGSGEASVPGAVEGADAGDPPPKPRVPWQTKRIDQLTATAKQEREAREALERTTAADRERLAAYEALYGKDGAAPPAGGTPTPTPTPPAGGRTYTEAELRTEAGRIAQANVLNQRLEDMFEQGSKAYDKTWEPRIKAAGQAFGDDLARRPDLFQAIADLPNGVDVYHELTGDLDHFADVLQMPPLRLGMELAKLSDKLAAKPKGPRVSGAPAPIDPVLGAGGTGEVPLDKTDMNDFAKRRMAQREARMKERGYA